MLSSRTRPEVIAILGVVLTVTALWGAWAWQTPGLFWKSTMQNSYIRFGRRFAIPSTVQILDELKTDFVPGYVPISRGSRRIYQRPVLSPEPLDAVRQPPQWLSPKGASRMPLESETPTRLSDQDLLERYGISRTPADYFHYGQYRYTNLKDAIAQAERDTPPPR
jgi:hypothetical protein